MVIKPCCKLAVKHYFLQTKNLRIGLRLQVEKGSPTYPSIHVQVAIWLITLHCALTPHKPGQGSTQCRFLQARVDGQSALIVHSGRHATYGSPK